MKKLYILTMALLFLIPAHGAFADNTNSEKQDTLVQRFQTEPPTPDEEFQIALKADKARTLAAFFNHVKAEHDAEIARQAREQARASVRKSTRSTNRVSQPSSTDSGGRHYICPQFASPDNVTGDFAIPCSNIDNESDGNYTADNPDSSACGAYQILHISCSMPPREQDALARSMALCNWHPPDYCKYSNN